MIAIAAADKNWAIGKNGKLLVRIPNDQKFFREKTLGKTVIMGRKTLDSLPGGQPLADRDNIVLTRDPGLCVPGACVVHSVEEALSAVSDLPGDDVFVIGGGHVYSAMLPHCDKAIITRIDFAYDADTFFPDLERDPAFRLLHESEELTYFDVIYRFQVYGRI